MKSLLEHSCNLQAYESESMLCMCTRDWHISTSESTKTRHFLIKDWKNFPPHPPRRLRRLDPRAFGASWPPKRNVWIRHCLGEARTLEKEMGVLKKILTEMEDMAQYGVLWDGMLLESSSSSLWARAGFFPWVGKLGVWGQKYPNESRDRFPVVVWAPLPPEADDRLWK